MRGLTSQILMAHAQKELLGDVAIASIILSVERVLLHDLLNNVLDFIRCLNLSLVLID